MTDATLAKSVLRPLAALYGLGITIRNTCYDRSILESHEVDIPILCIGNAIVGGSGKTPFTSYLAEQLKELGHSPVILLRGYGGSERGPLLAHRGCLASEVGEEALLHLEMLNHQVPVVISADRTAGAQFIEAKGLGDVVLLDDGFQHRRLARNLNILLLDISSEKATNKWLNGTLLPAGYLREHLHSAIARADIVVFVKKTKQGMHQVAQLTPLYSVPENIITETFELRPSAFVDLCSGQRFPIEQFQGTSATALTAIAAPDSFLEMLSSLDVSVSEQSKSYRDHHHFTLKNWQNAISAELPIVTTAKDAVKLRSFVTAPGQAFTLELGGSLNAKSESAAFWQAVRNVVSGAGRKFG